MSHCRITGLRIYHKPVMAGSFVHPEFFTLSVHSAFAVITHMYNGQTQLDKTVFRLAIAVVLKHFGILHPDVLTPPYNPAKLDDLSSIDFAEEVAAAFQVQSWASAQIKVQVAELTDCTCRAIMEGVAHDSTSHVVAAINSLPTSLAQQLYSWSDTAARLSQSLYEYGLTQEEVGYSIRMLLHLAAMESPDENEPPDTYHLMEVRVARLIQERQSLVHSLKDAYASAQLSPSEKRILKLLVLRAPKMPRNVSQTHNSPLVDSNSLSKRLAELRGKRS